MSQFIVVASFKTSRCRNGVYNVPFSPQFCMWISGHIVTIDLIIVE